MKGFIQILSCLSQEEDISKKICNISKLHQFFIDNIKSGEMKLSKVFYHLFLLIFIYLACIYLFTNLFLIIFFFERFLLM